MIEYCDRAGGGKNMVYETSDNTNVENHGFDPFCEPFVVPNGPMFRALSALRGAKFAQHGLKMGSFHLFVHPK